MTMAMGGCRVHFRHTGMLASRPGESRGAVDFHPTRQIRGPEGGRRVWIRDWRFWILDGTSDKLTFNPRFEIANPDRSLVVESQVTYFVTYSCPRCKAELEVQHGDWQGWRRCPACGL